MTKADLKVVMAQLEALGVPDSAFVKVQRPDLVRLDLQAQAFIVEGKDASYSIDNAGDWAGVVSEADAVVFKQV